MRLGAAAAPEPLCGEGAMPAFPEGAEGARSKGRPPKGRPLR